MAPDARRALSGFRALGYQVEPMAACCSRCAKFGLHRHRDRLHHPGPGIRGRIGQACLALAVTACPPGPLHAQSAQRTTATVALGSQLVDRGLAITPATPIVQGAISWISPTGWSAGLSGSAEVRSPGRLNQILLQASRYWRLSDDWQIQAGVLYYRHFGDRGAAAYDRGEAGVHWLYRDTLALGLSAIRTLGSAEGRTRAAADLDFHWPLTEHAFFSAGAGVAHVPAARYSHYRPYRSYDREGYYRYGQIGLGWASGPWRLELDRVMTDLEAGRSGEDLEAQPWMATISRSF
jgi:uncharacterized protein (TIGR02001 family)